METDNAATDIAASHDSSAAFAVSYAPIDRLDRDGCSNDENCNVIRYFVIN